MGGYGQVPAAASNGRMQIAVAGSPFGSQPQADYSYQAQVQARLMGQGMGRLAGLGGIPGMGRLGATQLSVSQQAQQTAQGQLQALTAIVNQVATALQNAQGASPSIDFSSVQQNFQQLQTQAQQIAQQINGATVTPFDPNAYGSRAQQLTQQQQAEAAQIQSAAANIAQVQAALQALPAQISAIARNAAQQQSAAAAAVQSAIQQAQQAAAGGQFATALAILNNPSLSQQAAVAGGAAQGNLQQAIQTVQGLQTQAPIRDAQQAVTAAIAQANTTAASGDIGSLQSALSILQGISTQAATAGMTGQVQAAAVPIQQALAKSQGTAASSTVSSAIQQAQTLAASGQFQQALAMLQEPSLQTQASQAGQTGPLNQAIAAILSQQSSVAKTSQQFAASQQQAMTSCQSQPGMIWTPGDMANQIPGSCAQSPQFLAQQQSCSAQGGNWTGTNCDMTAVNNQNQANQQAQAQAAQNAQAQAQLEANRAQANSQLAQACLNKGGNWDGTACDLSLVEQTAAQQQQTAALAQLASAFAPLLNSNPQLAAQVIGGIFGQVTGGSMAFNVPGAPGAGSMSTSGGRDTSGSINGQYAPAPQESF